jgi:hypothetical protein
MQVPVAKAKFVITTTFLKYNHKALNTPSEQRKWKTDVWLIRGTIELDTF